MTSTLVSRTPWLMSVLVAIVLMLGTVEPATAGSCFGDLERCYYRAALIDGWFDRMMAGIDCELAFADCLLDSLCH